jgi:hypothetical protein
MPGQILRELNQLVVELNKQTLTNGSAHRWETVVNVLAIAGGLASLWAAVQMRAASIACLRAR